MSKLFKIIFGTEIIENIYNTRLFTSNYYTIKIEKTPAAPTVAPKQSEDGGGPYRSNVIVVNMNLAFGHNKKSMNKTKPTELMSGWARPVVSCRIRE